MPNTIGSASDVTSRCAVIKVDLKGRFVFIDDAAEKVFEASCDELIGRSVFEFIANGSVQELEALLNKSSRYESDYRSIPLTIRTPRGEIKNFTSVLTLNFIGGNPVNYHIVLIPSRSGGIEDTEPVEKQLLRIINGDINNVDLNLLAKIFGRSGGYSNTECYRQDINGRLIPEGSWPHNNLDYTTPVYLEEFFRQHRTDSLRQESRDSLVVGLDGRQDQAGMLLRGDGDRDILVHLHGPAGYTPSDSVQKDLMLFADTWNRNFSPTNSSASVADRLSLLGSLVDAMEIGLAVVGGKFEFAYKNETINAIAAGSEPAVSDNISDFFDSLRLLRDSGEVALFENSVFAGIFNSQKTLISKYHDYRVGHFMTVIAAPFELEKTSLAAFLFVPAPVADNENGVWTNNAVKVLHNIAFDINPPLSVIEGMIRHLASNNNSIPESDSRTAFDAIWASCRQLRDLVKGLEELNANCLLVNTPVQVSIGEVISDLVKSLRKSFPDKQFEVEIDQDLPYITAPREKIATVFRCLLENAFVYSRKTTEPAIMVVYERKNDTHQFAVTDSGPGIPEYFADKMFDPFFRIPREAFEGTPGAGVGLTIALALAKSMGGNIHLESSREGGATFIFTLPVHDNE